MAQVVLAFDKKSARSFDADGRMRVKDCILSTAEINPYRGEEIPGWQSLGLDPSRVYDLYRDPEALETAAKSFDGVPLLVKHIPQTAEEPRKEYIGGSVHNVRFEGRHLRGDLLVMDGVAIELIESGKLSDLSCGYRYKPQMSSGEVHGAKFDGIMREIEGNHVALVEEGRATDAHVADAAFKDPRATDPALQGATDMPMSEHEAERVEKHAPEANPAAGAAPATPAPGSPAGEQNEQMNMAAIGQALKHIAELLTNIHAKIGGAEPAAPVAAAVPGAADNEEAPEGEEQAEDITLEPATKEISINGPGDGDLPAEKLGGPGNQGSQEGTPARGNPTPHGAMDAASVKKAIAAAVATERSRAAAVTAAAREVRGVLGDVYGMDDACAIYREALKVVGVDVSGVPAGAEKVAWQAYKSVRTVAAGAQPRTDASHALDADAAATARKGIAANLAKITILG